LNGHRYHLALLFVALFQVLVGFGVVLPILPGFVRSLGGGPIEMGLLVTVWAAAQFLFSPYWGSLSDRIGRKPVFLAGLAGYCVAFLGMALASTYWHLLLARVLGGLLSAATIPVAQAWIADITPDPAERGRRLGLMGGAMNLGFITGPALGGLLAPLGVQTTFLVVAGLAALNAAAAWALLPEPPVRLAPRPAITRAEMIRAALSRPLSTFSAVAFISTYGGSTLFSMLGYFMMNRFDAGPGLIGAVFTTEGLWATGIQAFGVGLAIRRFGAARTVRFALLLGVAGFLLLAWSPNLFAVFAAAVLVSSALSFLRPTITAMAADRTTLEQGVTMGVLTSFDSLGRAVGPIVAGGLYAASPWVPFAGAAVLYLGSFLWLGRHAEFAAAEAGK
jgi:MFS transporter, DHA1 family, multidrug resistance protein